MTEYVSDCENVRERVRRCLDRESAVIYPPVDTDYFRPVEVAPGGFYLWAGALAPYKRMDLALEAFRALDRELVVIGEGQDLDWARRTAPPNVKFLGRQPDDVLRRALRGVQGADLPGRGGFRHRAAGSPGVRAAGHRLRPRRRAGDRRGPGEGRAAGGRDGRPFREPTAAALVEAVRRFERSEAAFRAEALRANALRFSRERCKAAFRDYLLAPQKGAERC